MKPTRIATMNITAYKNILASLPEGVKLIAVSKTKPASDIELLYNEGQRAFGENKALEMRDKHDFLPKDIEWHFIGHLQTNKVKYIAPFVTMIHSIDSAELLQTVNKLAEKNNRVIPCLLQFHIAEETTKFGLTWDECTELLTTPEFSELQNIEIHGVMGMATFTNDEAQIHSEFHKLHSYFIKLKDLYFSDKDYFKEISMGMTDDYPIAIEEHSTMIRIGSAIFGARNYNKQ